MKLRDLFKKNAKVRRYIHNTEYELTYDPVTKVFTAIPLPGTPGDNFIVSLDISIDTATSLIEAAIDSNLNPDVANIKTLATNGAQTWFRKIKIGNKMYTKIIFPDEYGFAPWEKECNPKYKAQWTASDRESNRAIDLVCKRLGGNKNE